MDTLILDVGGAAEFLKVKKSTIYAWVYQRRIPFRKHGRRVVFDQGELAGWSQSKAIAPQQEMANCVKTLLGTDL